MVGCEDCKYEKDNGSERLRELEKQFIGIERDSHTTNLILVRIEDALTKYIDDSKKDIEKNEQGINENRRMITSMQPEAAVLKDRSNVQRELNYKALAGLIALIGFFGSLIASIIVA